MHCQWSTYWMPRPLGCNYPSFTAVSSHIIRNDADKTVMWSGYIASPQNNKWWHSSCFSASQKCKYTHSSFPRSFFFFFFFKLYKGCSSSFPCDCAACYAPTWYTGLMPPPHHHHTCAHTPLMNPGCAARTASNFERYCQTRHLTWKQFECDGHKG